MKLVFWGMGILCIFFSQNTLCQENRLAVFTYTTEGNSISLKETIIVDTVIRSNDAAAFHPAEPIIFYTSTKENKSTLLSFNWVTQERKPIYDSENRITNLAFIPGKKFLSFQEVGNDKSALIKLTPDGQQKTILAEIFPAENYLWMDDNALLAILPGDPNSLNLVTLRPRKQIPVVQHVGHTLSKATDKGPFAFVHKLSVDTWSIKEINSEGSIHLILNTLPEGDIFALTPAGNYIMSFENELFYSENKKAWNKAALPKVNGIITRIIVNEKGSHVALMTNHSGN